MRFMIILTLLGCVSTIVAGKPAWRSYNKKTEVSDVLVSSTGNAEDDNSGTSLLRNILDAVDKGHVTQDSMMRWMRQVQDAMNRGALSTATVAKFVEVFKQKLAGTDVVDNCCLFG
ncbi:hypothetical protein ACF0H5_021652 [Mactra antiquata]